MKRILVGALILLAGLVVGLAALFAPIRGASQPPSSADLPLATASKTEAAPLFGVAAGPSAQALQPTGIMVAGAGEVKTQPDMAFIMAGVQTRGATAQEAQQENARLMNAVLAKLDSMGYGKNEVRTTGLNVHPVYDRGGGSPSGYQAANQVVVTVNDVGQAGAVFDAVVAAGANVAGNISFGLKNDAPLRQQALQAAVRAARTKADAVAEALGVTITGVDAVIEESAGGPPVATFERAMPAMEAPTPVMPGELTITSQVRAIYRY